MSNNEPTRCSICGFCEEDDENSESREFLLDFENNKAICENCYGPDEMSAIMDIYSVFDRD